MLKHLNVLPTSFYNTKNYDARSKSPCGDKGLMFSNNNGDRNLSSNPRVRGISIDSTGQEKYRGGYSNYNSKPGGGNYSRQSYGALKHTSAYENKDTAIDTNEADKNDKTKVGLYGGVINNNTPDTGQYKLNNITSHIDVTPYSSSYARNNTSHTRNNSGGLYNNQNLYGSVSNHYSSTKKDMNSSGTNLYGRNDTYGSYNNVPNRVSPEDIAVANINSSIGSYKNTQNYDRGASFSNNYSGYGYGSNINNDS